jgi:lipopolysaccharide biosynthesis protein
MKSRNVIAIYYPQYHAIPINDKYWGEGFTDWNNVKKARPLFSDHDQPKVPLLGNYYDPRTVATLKEQTALAKKYGIYGFCFYHYWFDGLPLLETPILNFLNAKDIDFPFCLSWANETWTKRWIGDSKTVIIKQNHTPDKQLWEKHFNFLLPFFKDERAIKIDGKPIFLIYQPFLINQINEMLTYWQQLSADNGLPGLYFIATKRHEYFPESHLKMFSGVMKFQPSHAKNSRNFESKSIFAHPAVQKIRRLGEQWIDFFYAIKSKFERVKYVNSENIWKAILKEAGAHKYKGKEVFEGAYANWDNTARYGKKATVFSPVTPVRFQENMEQLFQVIEENDANNFIFFNAWNEWAEGAYLEPDEKFGYAYLEALKKVIVE